MKYLNSLLSQAFGPKPANKRHANSASAFVHTLTWPDGTTSTIRKDRQGWYWNISPGVSGYAKTLRDAIADATDNGASYAKGQRA